MDKKDTEHYKLGAAHALAGFKPYKFQDPYLQQLYDEGYNTAAKLERQLHREWQRRQAIPGYPGQAKVDNDDDDD